MSPFKTSKGIISTLGLAMLLRNYHATTISCHANSFSISIGGGGWEPSYISMTNLQRVKTRTPYRDGFLVFAICLSIYLSWQFSVESELLAQLSFKSKNTNYCYYFTLKLSTSLWARECMEKLYLNLFIYLLLLFSGRWG